MSKRQSLYFWCSILTMLGILFNLSACHAAERITVLHIVRQGETLADVGRIYANPDITDSRYLAEFTEGIREHNPVIWNREPQAGDRLQITFWAEIDYD